MFTSKGLHDEVRKIWNETLRKDIMFGANRRLDVKLDAMTF